MEHDGCSAVRARYIRGCLGRGTYAGADGVRAFAGWLEGSIGYLSGARCSER